MPTLRSPVVVGRDPELGFLRNAFAASASGAGSMVFVVGQAGIGKSRLVNELALVARRTAPVLIGRAVGHGQAHAFRPLAEALQAGLRASRDTVADRELDPFRPALGRLLHQWHATAGQVDTSPIVLAEGVLRLLRTLAGHTGLVFVLEDMHWADPDTLDVLEYLADNAADSHALILITARTAETIAEPPIVPPATDGSAIDDLLHRVRARGSAQQVELTCLGAAATRTMVRACVDGDPDRQLLEQVERRSGGLPLLVEELLAAGRDADGDLVVPRSVAEAIGARLDGLSVPVRRWVDLAAVIGERFDGETLGAVAGDHGVVLSALRVAARAGILTVRTDGGFAFRHALVRDAVLARLLPSERAKLAAAALRAVRVTHPDLPGSWCPLAAQLAQAAGDQVDAAGILLELARRDLARGALRAAESSLREAGGGELPDTLAADIDEALAHVLVEAGRPREAATANETLLARLARLSPEPGREAAAHLRLARAWTMAGEWRTAATSVRRARGLVQALPDAGADLLDALVAIGQNRFDDAHRFGHDALAGAAPEQECEALQILGQLARRTDLAAAGDLFERALAVAENHDLPVWRARALHELSTVDLFGSLRSDRAERARDEAERAGAVSLAAMAEYHLASILCWCGDHDRALRLLQRAEDTCRALRLPLLPMVLVMQAELHAQHARRSEVAGLCAEAEDRAPEDPHVRAAVLHAGATLCLLVEDRTGALHALDRAAEYLRAHDVATTWGPPLPRWALLATLERTPPAWPEVARLPGSGVARWTVGHLAHARAIDLGRAGDHAAAAAEFARGDHALSSPVPMPHFRHLARRLVAEAAVTDGWGNPVSWLREDAAYFEDAGHDDVAKACRGLLRRAGARVARRTPGPRVPLDLRRQNVTGREMEILELVVAGLTNTAIADRLVISRRTVEKHIAHLLKKTRCTDRADLIALYTGPADQPNSVSE